MLQFDVEVWWFDVEVWWFDVEVWWFDVEVWWSMAFSPILSLLHSQFVSPQSQIFDIK